MVETRIGIVGCGLIGASWCALFQSHGYDVAAWDPEEKARESLQERVAALRTSLRDLGIAADGGTARLYLPDTLEELAATCGFIQENAPEQLDTKREVFERIAKVAGPEVTVASSTSSLTWPDMFDGLAETGRWITAHPFNPPHLVPLVELYGLDPVRISMASALYRAVGKYPVVLKKPAVGHIANRLASALWREAVDMVASGIADPEDIDRALVQGPGLRWAVMGAHMAYHLGGGTGGMRHYLKHLGPSQERRWSTLGHPALTPDLCEMLAQGMERAAAGQDVASLENERDRSLAAILKARRTIPG